MYKCLWWWDGITCDMSHNCRLVVHVLHTSHACFSFVHIHCCRLSLQISVCLFQLIKTSWRRWSTSWRLPWRLWSTSRSTWRFARGYTERVSAAPTSTRMSLQLFEWKFLLNNPCSSSVFSSQRQHKQQSGAVVVLWSSGSGGDDARTDLLPEEIFRSTASGLVRWNDPRCPPLIAPHIKTVIYTLENKTGRFEWSLHVIRSKMFCSPVTCLVPYLEIWFFVCLERILR